MIAKIFSGSSIQPSEKGVNEVTIEACMCLCTLEMPQQLSIQVLSISTLKVLYMVGLSVCLFLMMTMALHCRVTPMVHGCFSNLTHLGGECWVRGSLIRELS